MPRVALIVNPLATAVDEHRISLVERTLAQAGTVGTHLTQARGHATELARELAPNVDAIFVYSGDGGFNEVANGLGAGSPPVGCIPGGGTSVFPRGLGIPRDPLRAAAHVADAFRRGRIRRISLGRVNGRRFLFSAGIGLDAELVRRIEVRRSRAGRPGDIAFLLTLAKVIFERRGRFAPEVDVDEVGRVAFLFVANADPYTFLGALPIHAAPKATLENGLDVFAPARVDPHEVVSLLRFVLTGRRLPRRVRTLHDVDRVHARCDRPLPMQADGEDLGDVTEATFTAEREALSVLA